MSRGARGGGARGGAGGGMRPNALPFELDAEFQDFVMSREAEENGREKKDVAIEIFPTYPSLPKPTTITDSERAAITIHRSIDAHRRAGPFWTGTKEQWTQYEAQSGKATGAFDPFEDASTYGRKNAKRAWRPADLAKIKLERRFFPPELWDTIDPNPRSTTTATNNATSTMMDGVDADGNRPLKHRKLGLVRSTVMDRLAKFDEGGDGTAGSDAEDGGENENDDEDEPNAHDEEGEDFDLEGGDVFDDDDDMGGDYNAERYFDAGEEDFDEGGGGGEEYEGDGY